MMQARDSRFVSESPHEESADDVLASVDSDRNGLSTAEADRRLREHGEN